LAAAVALGPLLGGFAQARGAGVLGGWQTLIFPYLWLYLFIEGRVRRQALSDGQVFLLGCAFSFIYEGLLTKAMQDSFSISGLNWMEVLGGPLEWGMIVVVWLHCLQALVPREEAPVSLPGRRLVLVGAPVLAAVIFLWKSRFSHYRAQYYLGPMWWVDDAALAAAAVWLWRRYRQSLGEPSYQNPPWVWALAGLGLGLFGSGLLAEACLDVSALVGLAYAAEILWLAAWGLFLWTAWRDRLSRGDETVRRSRPVLAAAGLRVAWPVVLLSVFSAADDPARMSFWSGLLCDWPSKILFYYAFLTSRLEV
jgi:hypothetical protein